MVAASLHRFARLSWGDRFLLAEALATLAGASLAIRLLPFRRLVRVASALGRFSPARPSDEARVRKLIWAIRASARRAPWRTVCFQCGLAAHVMLRRRGIASLLHYGVAQKEMEGLKAHVWVSVGGRDVIGGEEAAGFTCLATYPPAEA